MSKQFCPYGHNTFIVGRDKDSYCKECKKKRNKLRGNQSQYKRTNRELLKMLKATPCVDCGVQYPPFVMQFDHVRGTKEFNIGSHTYVGKQRFLDEIDKCDIVCANCHAIRTWG